MKVETIKTTTLKLIVLSLPFAGWSPLGIQYTGITFLLMYFYFAISIIYFKISYSKQLFKELALPLFMVWLIMFIMTFVNPAPGAQNAGSILRQFLFYWLFML